MKTLLVDYSWSNTTAQLATVVQQVTGAERLDLTVAKGTFPNDMYATSDVAQQQLASGDLPALTTPLPDFNQYTRILVGGAGVVRPCCNTRSAVFAPVTKLYGNGGTVLYQCRDTGRL